MTRKMGAAQRAPGGTLRKQGKHYRDAHFGGRVKAALGEENTPKGRMFRRFAITRRAVKAVRRRK